MPKIDLASLPQASTTTYPPPFDQPVAGRLQRRVGRASGLTELGANEVTLEPGAWSSQRHWHESEDEFLVMLEGEAVLVEDEGRTMMRAGDLAAWPKGVRNGHHLINESAQPCRFIVFSAGVRSWGEYSDIDMKFTADGRYTHKDGTPY